jgi:hypothetical protein
VPLSDAPDTAIGYVAEPSQPTGGAPWAVEIDHLLEEIPELTDRRQAVRAYTRVRRDPQITAILSAIELLIQNATWAIDDAGASEQMTRQAADDLGLPIIGEDKPKAARVRGVMWEEHLRAACLTLPYGHMGFEPEAAIMDGRARLVALHERMPATIEKIDHDRQGRLVSVTQESLGSQRQNPIPADRLVWYTHKREGAAWRGQSILRPAYGPWLIKHEMLRVHATGIRRFSAGVPVVEAPPGATPQQIEEARRLASRARVGENSGAGLPAGFVMRIVGLTGSTPDPMPFIEYLDRQMSRMVLAQFLDYGTQTVSGNRALAGSTIDFFTMAVGAVANALAVQATRQITVPMTNWNEGEGAPAPAISVTDVGTAHEVTAEAITSLVQAGVLTMDDATEDYVRQAWRLPRRTSPRPAPAPVQAPAGAPAVAASRREVRLAAAAGEDDPASAAQQLDDDWQAALAALLLAYRVKRQSDVEELVAQVRDLATAGDLAGLAGLAVTATGDGVTLIADAMAMLAESGAASAVAEAAAQGVTVAVPDTGALAVDLSARAAVVDDLLTSGLANSAVREATRKWGLDPAELAVEVQAALEGLSDAWVEGHLGGALTAAQNAGRGLVFEAGPAARFTAVEVLDAVVCRPCAQVAGREYASWGDAVKDYPAGQYRACLGRERCRGFLIATYLGA